MINKNNELPSFVNETNLPKIVDKLTDAKNIKISNNKYGNRVQTVIDKIVEKADDITKAIKQEVVNNSYSFKVGTGDVDVSADVQDGFGEVGVKGVTYQNILKGFDDSKWTGNHIEKNGNQCKLTQNSTSEYLRFRTDLIKKNTKYTLIYTVTENTMVDLSLCINGENVSSGENCIDSNMYIPNVLGTHIVTFTSSSLNDKTIKYFRFAIRSTTEDGTYVVLKNPILLEGDHTNNPNLPSYFEGIVGVGDKSKNLFDITNSTIGKYLQGNIGSGYGTYGESSVSDISDYIPVVANKTYVFSYDFKKLLGTGDRGYCFYNENKELITSNKNTLYSSTSKKLILTPSVNGYVRVCYDKNCLDIQLEEGSTATSYEPYYDGHKIEILSNGKNLFDIQRYLSDNENSQYYKISADGGLEILKLDSRSSFKNLDSGISVKRNTAYSIKCSLSWDSLRVLTQKNNVWSNIRPTNYQFYSGDSDMIYIKFVEDKNFPKIVTHIQVEESSTPSSYQPCFADKTQILLDEPLMRLPSGVCDEITRDGKLIKRVGKIVFDGTENWSPYNINGNTTHFAISIPYIDKFNGGLISHIENNNNKFMCDKALVTQTRKENLTSICSFYYGPENRYFMFNLPCSSLESAKNWLIENKPILYFPLPTPIITELPAPYLRIFKDGHLTFNTLVAPESNHVVQLNKSAQIQNAIKESQSLDNRINVLENNYDNLMLSTISRLNDLEFNYTLK